MPRPKSPSDPSAPINLRVPKSMPVDAVIWAFRYGVVNGMRRRGRVIPKAGMNYVQAPHNVLLLGSRVLREYLRRHPEASS